MEEIIKAFGIDWRLIVIQMFNFAILAAALVYFLYTPILKILSERENKIKKGIEDAEAASIALTEADVQKKSILSEAQDEATQIVSRAEVHAEEKGVAIVQEAESKAQRVLLDAERKAEEIQEKSKKESDAEIVKTAILAAEKILIEKVSK